MIQEHISPSTTTSPLKPASWSELGEIWGFVTDGYYTQDDFTDIQTWQLKEGVVTVNGVNPHWGYSTRTLDDENSTNRIDYGNGTEENPGTKK